MDMEIVRERGGDMERNGDGGNYRNKGRKWEWRKRRQKPKEKLAIWRTKLMFDDKIRGKNGKKINGRMGETKQKKNSINKIV